MVHNAKYQELPMENEMKRAEDRLSRITEKSIELLNSNRKSKRYSTYSDREGKVRSSSSV